MEKAGNTWLAAVSAGPDSMALLSMCLEQGIPCAAAHVNYHHRKEADEEESWVRLFCAEHHVPLYVRNEPFVYEGNFEAAARTWRYDFFEKVVREHGYKGVLVAHHEDDLLETYFMQEEKNIVPAYYGLKEEMMYHGILVRRPLLGMTKKELVSYCESHGIRYYTDSTNADESLTRNRIRHQIVEPMSRMERDMARREIAMKNAAAQERFCRVGTLIRKRKVSLSEYRKLSREDREALLRKVIETEKHYSLSFIQQLDGVLMKKNDFDLPVDERHLVQKDGQFFMAAPLDSYEYTFASKEEILSSEGVPEFKILPPQPGVNAVTVDEKDFPLTIRNVRPGDQIEMRFGLKKVHRFFIDRHIPLYLRGSWPVVVNRKGAVILVPGLGCDKSHYSVCPDFNVVQ
jgi:tRNA(Ile)-lysidine synthase